MINRKQSFSALGICGVLFGIVLTLHATPGRAEILPTKGTFRGVYRVNRAGVGKLRFFVIPKALKPRMAPREGKYVELEVLKARQPRIPGPVVIEQLGRVKKLPSPPLRIRLRAAPSSVGTGKSFDVICSLVNVGKKEVRVNANDLRVGVRGYSLPPRDDEPDHFLRTGYTRRQLSFGGALSQQCNFVAATGQGDRTHFFTGEVLIRPGESAPFVRQGVELKPGQYELAASLAPKKGQPPVAAAEPFDVPSPQPKKIGRVSLAATAKVSRDNEWLVVEGRVSGKSGTNASVFTLSERGMYFLPGVVRAYSASGSQLTASLDWPKPEGPWRRTKIGAKGLPFRFRIRHADRFSNSEIGRIELLAVADRGLETVTLANDVPETVRNPPTPWGAKVQGCRLRIRTAARSFKAGGEIRLFFQVESDGQKADAVWVAEGELASGVVVTIDGNKARLRSTGISAGILYPLPFQGQITLTPNKKLTAGKHILRLSVRGDAGTYTNLKGEQLRQYGGTLVSNPVKLEIRE